jgi:ring-1,2-phenylacetyl-CoA epoxidase subunit PaaE
MTAQGVEFHQLTVTNIEPLTSDSVAITLGIPEHLEDSFRFTPGQHIAVKAEIDGEDIRRTYSVCADPAENRLRIGVKRIEGGAFSTYATERLQEGDQIEAGSPYGDFTITPDPGTARHYGAIVAGSGITPVLSMISAVLGIEPASRFTLLFGNRTSASIMFLEDLEGLKDRYPDRFHIVHVLSQEAQIIPILSGRLDEARLAALFDTIVDVTAIDVWYLCGPYEMVQSARTALAVAGADAATIHDELFFSQPAPQRVVPRPEGAAGAAQVTFTLDGRTSAMAVVPDGPPILAYALEQRRDAPFSCRGGMCTTCKAQVVSGEVTMDLNFALTAEDLEKGYILTCQAHPKSDQLTITYDV